MRTAPTHTLHLLPLLAAGGCTLLVGAELSDKPAETAGAGGQGGSGTSSSNGQTSNAQSSNGQTSSSSGTVTCPPNTANCDGIAAHGCNVNLDKDPDNCGSCANICMAGMSHCAGGECK
jgi:hypothetical protein